jgi:hypothetical protein
MANEYTATRWGAVDQATDPSAFVSYLDTALHRAMGFAEVGELKRVVQIWEYIDVRIWQISVA